VATTKTVDQVPRLALDSDNLVNVNPACPWPDVDSFAPGIGHLAKPFRSQWASLWTVMIGHALVCRSAPADLAVCLGPVEDSTIRPFGNLPISHREAGACDA
jgi:hypothetical protein